MGPTGGIVSPALDRTLVAELIDVITHVGVGSLHRAVRKRRGPHQEEGTIPVLANERQHPVVHQIGAVLRLRVLVVTVRVERVGALVERSSRSHEPVAEIEPPVVLPEERRVIGVCLPLANTSEVGVETHLTRCAFARRTPDAPLADHARGITGIPQHCAQCRSSGLHRSLALERRIAQHGLVVPNVTAPLHLVVGADVGVAAVTPRQQSATSRRGERSRSVHLCETDAACAQ